MVFDDHVHIAGRRELREAPQSIGGEVTLLLRGTTRLRVDPDRVTTQILGRVYPSIVVLDGLQPSRGVGIPKRPLAVAHDEEAPDTVIVGSLLEVRQVLTIPGLVLEERVHVLHAVQPVVRPRDNREIEIAHLPSPERAVQ